MSKDELLPVTDPAQDGDFEFTCKIDLAKDLYMKGHSIEDVAKRTEIKKWTIHAHVHKGVGGESPWLEQRKLARTEFVSECQELTKVSLSKAYRTTGEVLFKCLEEVSKDLESGRMKPQEKIRLVDTLVRGVKEIHTLFMPAMKSPLVNIALSQNPKMSEAEVMEQLIDWGLGAKNEDRSETE